MGVETPMPRAVRKARNQELFRQVNDTIADLDLLRGDGDSLALICECSSLGCAEPVDVPVSLYATLRNDPTAFIVGRGHEDPEHESVVADHGSFLLVRER
jgi:hypothetical protein